MKRSRLWLMTCIAAILLAILTFTPLVIPAGVSTPRLGPLPYTLWMGFVVAGLFVTLTWIGTRVHPVNEEEEV